MSARDQALQSLDRLDLPGWPAGSLSSSRPARLSDDRDIELAARIESAALKNLLQINARIERLANRPLNKVDPRIRKILGVALAQILYLDRIPPSAVVDEAVKQAKRFGRTSAAGFVNAIVRRATRESAPDLPDAGQNPREYARLALSHPPELFDRLVALLGTEDALRFCAHDQQRPPTILRLSTNVSIEAMKVEGITITPHERAGMVVVQPTPHHLLRDWSDKRIAQAQDPTSAAVASFCDLQPGMNVLDRCCGLGTKTLQLREQLGDTGSIVAIDPDLRRICRLREIVKKQGFTNIQVIQGDRMQAATDRVATGGFDRVLIDVPCSNSGVLARRSAARYFQSDQVLASLEKLQLDILTDTAPAVAPGGLLVYSTCSIWPEENERLVERFLQSHAEFTQLEHHTTLPSFQTTDPTRYHDGGYVAVLKRS